MLLAWNWSGSDNKTGHVFRAGPKDVFTKIANVDLTTEEYSDEATTLKVGDLYCYKVCAGTDQTNCSNIACAFAKEK